MPDNPSQPSSTARKLERGAVQLAEQGRLKEAAAACQQLTQTHPDYAHGWYTTSNLALRLNNPQTALGAIDKALALQPGVAPWSLHRATCLTQLGMVADARLVAQNLSRQAPSSPQDCAALGLLLSQLDLMAEACIQYQRAIDLAPGEGGNYYNLATVQRALGDLEAARENLSRATELDPQDYDAWYALAELYDPAAKTNHIQELEGLLHAGIDRPRDKVQILYALARELEETGDSRKSFRCLRQGADLRRKHLKYQAQSDLNTMARLRIEFSADLFSGERTGADHREPIFVLGLPRTGTTLVERILGAHSSVQAAGELNDFPRQMMSMVRELALAESGNGQPPSRDHLLALTTALDYRKLGDAYVQSTCGKISGSAYFIDKLPLNFLYTGLIHLALPNAKIIHVQRHPVDSCYAMYKTLFRDAYPFSYELQELADYYLAYRELMAHWHAVMPGVIHTLRYENLVADVETETRGLLDYCGLPWESRCLAFQQNRTSSTTASAAQVRRGLYSTSVGKWRQYEEELRPLTDQLIAAGVNIEAQ